MTEKEWLLTTEERADISLGWSSCLQRRGQEGIKSRAQTKKGGETTLPEELREKIAQLIDVAGLYDSGVTPKGLADQILSLIQPFIEQRVDELVTKDCLLNAVKLYGYKTPEEVEQAKKEAGEAVGDRLNGVYSALIEQAKNEGFKAGMTEVAKYVNSKIAMNGIDMALWQAKLKEWGLES